MRFLLLAGLLMLPAAAHAQADCRSAPEMAEFLAAGYGETPVASGLTMDGSLLVVFSNPETGSWTVVTVDPSGLACMRSGGGEFTVIPQGEPT